MSEYKFVEKPFLDQLLALGWTVINQGAGIPQDPSKSLRANFRDVVLKEELFKSLKGINKTEDGKSWITDHQLEEIYDDLTSASGSLIEANQEIQEMLYKYTLDENKLTGDKSPDVKIIDFQNPLKNSFIAINQFRIDTPGRVKDFIIPDIVLFVNGLPLVVIECKDNNEFTSNPLSEAMIQLWRYSNQRSLTQEAGLKEGEEKLFHFNQFVIATHGEEAKYGSITSNSEQYFYNWRTIYPKENEKFTPPLGKIREQETLIQGMLPKETLLDIVRSFTIFMHIGENTVKVVPRYQQYRAVCKIISRLKSGKNHHERSGVVWHTQGSGKSLTMVFLVRRLRRVEELKDYKVILVNDRTDLEEQLTNTAALTGETVKVIDSSKSLKENLANDFSNLNMVMIHKFMERNNNSPEYINNTISSNIPKFEHFGVVNSSEKILILIDEAHRTQSSDLGNNLFGAFPNSSKIAFTGTPLITDRHKDKTINRFGGRAEYLDTYKLKDSVADGATVQILYEGKTADTAVKAKHEFDRKFEDLFKDRTAEELAKIKQKYGAIGDIFEAEGRIQEIADDIVEHYITKILPNGFKAQVVCHSKDSAIKYNKCIKKSLDEYIGKLKEQNNHELLKNVQFLKAAVVISSDGTNEKAEITMARKLAKENNVIENFKKKFDYNRTETGITFLIVCDMLLTGFDAPIEQVMYLDKKISEHNLLQAIARVNRVFGGKTKGYIIDYVGLANHLKYALSIYSTEEQQEILDSFKGVEAEIPVLQDRYKRLLSHFQDAGITDIRSFVEQKIKDAESEYELLDRILDSLEDIKRRETFNVYFKNFIASLDVVVPNPVAQEYYIPTKRFGYIHAKAKQRYKDNSISIAGAGEKVRRLIDEHLIGLGINPKIPPTELFSDNFIVELNKNLSAKSKASEMEHAIRKHIKIHLHEDPVFYGNISEKLDNAIKKYEEDWEQLYQDLFSLRSEAHEGRKNIIDGLEPSEAPFYDLIKVLGYGSNDYEVGQSDDKKIKDTIRKMYEEFQNTIDIVNFWNNSSEKKKLRSSLSQIILASGIEELINKRENIITEIMQLAKVRHDEIIAGINENGTI
ncbi:MAG: HsdR family type I site-specific deoxyribonuclease [bacterium]